MPVAALTHLGTHVVENQPPAWADVDFYAHDLPLREAVRREAGDWLDRRAAALGPIVGGAAVLQQGVDANRHPPELVVFDRYGGRLDEVRFHPSYHALMGLAMDHAIHDIAWTAGQPGAHVGHAALLALFAQAEAGTMCPINMSYAAVPVLKRHADVGQPWLDGIVGGRYDAPLAPIAGKGGLTLGMAMTEKQGGSDVRANTTRAEPAGEGWVRLTGHKWFCSAPMSDGFLTLAQTGDGLSCFLVPRVVPDGTRNAIRLMRLKDKLGNRSNASAEIEYEGAFAQPLGEPGEGVKTIIEMVHHTRLGTVACTLGIMRRALAEAINHTAGRRAFGAALIDQPTMAAVLADLALDYEAGVALVMRVARAYDGGDVAERAFARLGVALAKYWLAKRCPAFVAECLECHGGVGYVEETPLPRLYREAPLNAIWEGSGNVIALDVLRTLQRDPMAMEAFQAEVLPARGNDADFDQALRTLLGAVSDTAIAEAGARALVERLALLLAGALLLRHAPPPVAHGFCAARLGEDRSLLYGALPPRVAVGPVLARQRAG